MLSQQAGMVYVASNTVCSACAHTSPDPYTSWLCYHESITRKEVCLKAVWVDLYSNQKLSAAQTVEQQPFFKARLFLCPCLSRTPAQPPALLLGAGWLPRSWCLHHNLFQQFPGWLLACPTYGFCTVSWGLVHFNSVSTSRYRRTWHW